MPQPKSRAPTARDDRIRAGMVALMTHQTVSAASKACGIPRITLERWRDSDEGAAILEELKATPAVQGLAAKMLEASELATDQLIEALKNRKVPATALAINAKIMAEGAKQLAPKAEGDGGGDFVVQVFGGTLSSPAGAPAQGVAVQVTARKGGGGA